MFSGQPARTTADGFVLVTAATASRGATSRMGKFPPRVSASQTSLASSATTRIGPDNAMADTPPTLLRTHDFDPKTGFHPGSCPGHAFRDHARTAREGSRPA